MKREKAREQERKRGSEKVTEWQSGKASEEESKRGREEVRKLAAQITDIMTACQRDYP